MNISRINAIRSEGGITNIVVIQKVITKSKIKKLLTKLLLCALYQFSHEGYLKDILQLQKKAQTLSHFFIVFCCSLVLIFCQVDITGLHKTSENAGIQGF